MVKRKSTKPQIGGIVNKKGLYFLHSGEPFIPLKNLKPTEPIKIEFKLVNEEDIDLNKLIKKLYEKLKVIRNV